MILLKQSLSLGILTSLLGLTSPLFAAVPTFERIGDELINFTPEERVACEDGFLGTWGPACLRQLGQYPINEYAVAGFDALPTAKAGGFLAHFRR